MLTINAMNTSQLDGNYRAFTNQRRSHSLLRPFLERTLDVEASWSKISSLMLDRVVSLFFLLAWQPPSEAAISPHFCLVLWVEELRTHSLRGAEDAGDLATPVRLARFSPAPHSASTGRVRTGYVKASVVSGSTRDGRLGAILG